MSNEDRSLAPRDSAADMTPMRPSNMGDALRLAEVMCKGRLVPTHLQNSVADCLMVIEQAARWGLSPFAVAQCTSVIGGKLMFEGKLVAAVVNGRGELARRLDFAYEGSGESRAVRAFATLRGEDAPREVVVYLRDVRTRNEMWGRQPDQQLAYASARIWARRHMPELMLGIYAAGDDEVDGEEMGDLTPPPPPPAPKWTAGTENAPKREVIRGFDDGDEEEQRLQAEYTEPVSVYDPATGEEVRREPGITSEQNKKIHALLRDVRNQYDDVRYRKDLKAKFCKEHTNELSVREASKVIEVLLKRYDRIRPEMEAQARDSAALQAERAAAAGMKSSHGDDRAEASGTIEPDEGEEVPAKAALADLRDLFKSLGWKRSQQDMWCKERFTRIQEGLTGEQLRTAMKLLLVMGTPDAYAVALAEEREGGRCK